MNHRSDSHSMARVVVDEDGDDDGNRNGNRAVAVGVVVRVAEVVAEQMDGYEDARLVEMDTTWV